MKKLSAGLIIEKNKVNTCSKLSRCELVHRKKNVYPVQRQTYNFKNPTNITKGH